MSRETSIRIFRVPPETQTRASRTKIGRVTMWAAILLDQSDAHWATGKGSTCNCGGKRHWTSSPNSLLSSLSHVILRNKPQPTSSSDPVITRKRDTLYPKKLALTSLGRYSWALVDTVMNLRVPWNAGKLSSGLTSSGLSSSAQLHRVS
jgi:hypothetical protein